MGDPIRRCLENAVATQQCVEMQLRGFAGQTTFPEALALFATHAEEKKLQCDRLIARLHELGGEPSGLSCPLAHLLSMAPKATQIASPDEEATTQHLIIAYAAKNAGIAMYESLIIECEIFGDPDTAELVRDIQSQEKAACGKVWKLIDQVATDAFMRSDRCGNPLISPVEDAHAAERNLESALDSFSTMGDQAEVRTLMAIMSAKTRTQHERLENRLKVLGGSPCVAKSLLAHVLAFAPLSAQIGHAGAEKSTQCLVIIFAAASAGMAMYESLTTAARTAGDDETERLARELQGEKREDRWLAWQHLTRSAPERRSNMWQPDPSGTGNLPIGRPDSTVDPSLNPDQHRTASESLTGAIARLNGGASLQNVLHEHRRKPGRSTSGSKIG